MCFGDGAFVGGAFEFGQPMDHFGNVGGVFRHGAADFLRHCSTSSAFNIVANFVVVSATSSSGSDSATMPPPARARAVRRSADSCAQRMDTTQWPSPLASHQPTAPA